MEPARVVVTSPEAFPARAAHVLAEALTAAVAEATPHDRPGPGLVSLSLAGGSTPRPVYEILAGLALPWGSVEIYFGDERCVAPDDPASNYRMVRESLLDRIPVPPERIHRMACESGSPELAADRYAELLPDRLDVLVLGIGTDGHTASLFPGASTLVEDSRRVAPARSPEKPHERLTVTPRVIQGARHVVVLAAGPAKAGPVHRALEGPLSPVECPAQLARSGTWVLDRDAAALLEGPA